MLNQQSRSFPWLFLAVLALAHLFAVLDRVVISLLVESIKEDLGLSDTQISLLQGLAFTLGLVVMLIPMGILVDRVSRTRLLAASVGVWSLMTGLCGMANSFGMLFLARMGIAIGEASLHPTGYSLISDIFEKRRLSTALSIFQIGGVAGTGLSFIAGGFVIGLVSQNGITEIPLLGTLRPWQLTFMLVAIPGFFVAFLVNALPDPPRGNVAMAKPDRTGEHPVRAFYRQNKRLLISHHVALGISALVLLAAYSWVAPLFSRVHGWDAASIGIASGAAITIGTPLGLLAGGLIGDYLTRYGAHMRLVVGAVSVGCGAVCGVLYPLVSDPWMALLIYGALGMFATLPVGVGNAALQHVVPSQIRGRVSSIYYMTLVVVQVIGPTAVAVIGDSFFPFPTGIRYALAIVIPASLLTACLLYLSAIPPYKRLIHKLEAEEEAAAI